MFANRFIIKFVYMLANFSANIAFYRVQFLLKCSRTDSWKCLPDFQRIFHFIWYNMFIEMVVTGFTEMFANAFVEMLARFSANIAF